MQKMTKGRRRILLFLAIYFVVLLPLYYTVPKVGKPLSAYLGALLGIILVIWLIYQLFRGMDRAASRPIVYDVRIVDDARSKRPKAKTKK